MVDRPKQKLKTLNRDPLVRHDLCRDPGQCPFVQSCTQCVIGQGDGAGVVAYLKWVRVGLGNVRVGDGIDGVARRLGSEVRLGEDV